MALFEFVVISAISAHSAVKHKRRCFPDVRFSFSEPGPSELAYKVHETAARVALDNCAFFCPNDQLEHLGKTVAYRNYQSASFYKLLNQCMGILGAPAVTIIPS